MKAESEVIKEVFEEVQAKSLSEFKSKARHAIDTIMRCQADIAKLHDQILSQREFLKSLKLDEISQRDVLGLL